MLTWSDVGDLVPALDGFEVNDQGKSENTAVLSVATVDAHALIRLAAWDDGLGIDVDPLLTLPNARTIRDHLSRAIEIVESREQP